jgi:histidinol-phosphate aminotransferase
MIHAKRHLVNIHRVHSKTYSRRHFLRLDMNEGFEGLPEPFIRNVLNDIRHPFLAMYPEYQSLIKKIAKHNGCKPENICLSNGSDGAIKYIFDAYISSGDSVLLTDPTFAMYPIYCALFKARALTVQYQRDLSFPTERFIRKLKNVKMAVLVNPNNPTGSIVPPDDVMTIIKIAHSRGIILLADEAYFYYYPHTVIDLISRFDNLIVLRTFSKLCGLAAARLGYAAACSSIITDISKVKPSFDVSGVSVLLGERVMDHPSIIRHAIRKTAEGKEYLLRHLSRARIDFRDGSANFVLIRCNNRVKAVMKTLRENKILVGGDFQHPGLRNYIRVTIGSISAMRKFLGAFMRVLKDRHA